MELFKNKKIVNEVLTKFKPILVVYYPYEYNLDKERNYRLEALKAKLGKQFFEHYLVLFIPHSYDSFKLDLLSVMKSKFLKDSDLSSYIDKLQQEIIDKEDVSVETSFNIKDMI